MTAYIFFFLIMASLAAEPVLKLDFTEGKLPESTSLKVSEKVAEKLKDTPVFVKGRSGTALNCGGYSQYGYFASTTSPFSKAEPFTLTCWFNPRGGYLTALVYYKPGWDSPMGFAILQNGSQLALKIGKRYVIQSDKNNPVQKNKWYFLALSWDGKTWKLFLNGMNYTAKENPPFLIPGADCPLNIGGYNTMTNNIFQGLVEEVRIYPKALSDETLFQIIEEKLGQIH